MGLRDGGIQLHPENGQISLTHVLTHTGLVRSGRGRFQRILEAAKHRKKASKRQLSTDKVMSTSAHNPEVAGSIPVSTNH